MNTLVHYALTLTIFFLGLSEVNAQWKHEKVVGNGNVTTKTVNTSDYTEIKAVGSMDVHLHKGTEGTITVTTDENLQEYIIVEVQDGNTLVIKTKNNTSLTTKNGIHVTVPFQDIKGVSLVGSGDIDSKNTIQSDAFEVSVTGSGDLVLDIDANELDAKVTGSGDMKLSGKAQTLELKLSGSGNFMGGSMISQNVQVYVSGSGDAEVMAKSNIKARVNGSGDIRYSGSPEKSDTKVMGSGSIRSM
ncbi:putative autotransporter adhesin-like protein [Ulvibacter sp. MAR_2010_11]|uniref:head GIN domain-containing protein n=1 Tax=Ulvibacter sp. MAR_2010_11 TaxID=1250229 RepID=UPI000C2BD515|nr:head GIN domain-containing protein [Ulvibacter sp. MAR_2010_11]PKA84295.1 putative autotransporter adhesin-like protein [Ulvibacter sp. MAR_2010_11]